MMEKHCACLQRLWIIEYAWAHNMLDIFKDVETPFWLDDDWESLSLDESWRVRVASAQVFSIIRKRQIGHYERVLVFLEKTHTLLPTLMPAIKHMKITFGLKTMVIMWMLREGAGPVNVVQKINKYFPRKLPQYLEHCKKHDTFLLRQNQLDFRSFAQQLIMDKRKLEDYVQNHVEEQYGDHYAQKTEERLLNYLQELNKVLPMGTYIDKILMKNSFLKEEEKALLDLITDDSKTISTTLKTLLNFDPAFCYCLHKSELRKRMSSYIAPEFQVSIGVSTDQTAAETVRHVESSVTDTIMNDADGVRREQDVAAHKGRTKETADVGAEKTITVAKEKSCLESGAHVVIVPPHFCSKHQRWVRNILCECPGEPSDEQPSQNSEISPLLFTSTSASSSSDLTPSNITIPPDRHQPPYASDQLQETGVPVDSGPPLHPSPTAVQTFIPGGAVKVVIVPCNAVTTVTVCPLKSNASSNDLSNNCYQDSTCSTFNISAKNPMSQTATSSTPFISKLSRRFRLGQSYSQSQKMDKNEDGQKYVECSSQTGLEMIDAASFSAKATSGIDISSAFSNSRMQPCVVLTRLSIEQCLKATKGRVPPRQCDNMEENSDPAASSFDVNSLYSTSSSSSEEEEDSDTEYRPDRKTLRRWFLGY